MVVAGQSGLRRQVEKALASCQGGESEPNMLLGYPKLVSAKWAFLRNAVLLTGEVAPVG